MGMSRRIFTRGMLAGMALAAAAIERDVQSGQKGAVPAVKGPAAGALSVLISGADREIFALQNGAEVIKAPVTIIDPDQPLGTHVFVFAGKPGSGGRWLAVSVGKSAQTASGNADDAQSALQRVQLSADTSSTLRPMLHAGATLMITDLPATPDTRSGSDFVILRQSEA
jgi:hypothetical protein